MNRKFKLSGLLIFLALSLSLMTGLVLNLNDFIQGFKGVRLPVKIIHFTGGTFYEISVWFREPWCKIRKYET